MDFCYYCESQLYPDDETVSVPNTLSIAHIECSEEQDDSGHE